MKHFITLMVAIVFTFTFLSIPVDAGEAITEPAAEAVEFNADAFNEVTAADFMPKPTQDPGAVYLDKLLW